MPDYHNYLYAHEMAARSSVMAGMLGEAGELDRAVADRNLESASRRVDRLLVLIDALWSLLEDEGFSDEDLRRRVAELEVATTTAAAADPVRCPDCGSVLDLSRSTCAICGKTRPQA